ncbi:MAG: hypothetical protein M3394_03560 [Actinomycetota bacterium]|nr:hypothetical protein [Actinomycetota bacterium]
MPQIELRLDVERQDADDDELAESAAVLLEELAQLDVDDVAPAGAGAAPAGSKGLELVAIGSLVVKLVRSTKVLSEVVDVVRDWLNRNNAKSVRLEIDGDVLEISNASAEERKALVDVWIRRHAEP